MSNWFETEAETIGTRLKELATSPNQTLSIDGMVTGVMDQVYSSRAAFKDDCNHMVTVMLALFTAGGVLLHQALQAPPSDDAVTHSRIYAFVAALAFLLPALIGKGFLSKIEAGYYLYAHACTYASLVFRGLGLIVTDSNGDVQFPHQWLRGSVTNLTREGAFLNRPTAPGAVQPHGLEFIETTEWKRLLRSPWRRLIRSASWRGMPMGWRTLPIDSAKDKPDLVAVWKASKPNLFLAYRATACIGIWIGMVLTLVCGAYALGIDSLVTRLLAQF
jgi:hypothetical protein